MWLHLYTINAYGAGFMFYNQTQSVKKNPDAVFPEDPPELIRSAQFLNTFSVIRMQ